MPTRKPHKLRHAPKGYKTCTECHDIRKIVMVVTPTKRLCFKCWARDRLGKTHGFGMSPSRLKLRMT